MKVDGKHIFVIVTHYNVVVEKTLKHVTGPNEVPVYANFDFRDLIGIAKMRYGGINVYADISLFGDVRGFPAIAVTKDAQKVQCFALAITSTPNVDKFIKSL